MSETVTLAKPYSLLLTLWKGLRPALIVGAAAGISAFLDAADASALTSVGVPSVLAVFVVEAVRNYWKQHRV